MLMILAYRFITELHDTVLNNNPAAISKLMILVLILFLLNIIPLHPKSYLRVISRRRCLKSLSQKSEITSSTPPTDARNS